MLRFVGNLTDFKAVKDYENLSRFDEIIVTRWWHIFWDTVYVSAIMFQNYKLSNMVQFLAHPVDIWAIIWTHTH